MSEKETPDDQSSADTPAEPPTQPPTEASPGRAAWLRGKAGAIGAGLALALVAGLGGFALGQVTGDGDGHNNERGDHGSFHGDHRGRG